MLKKIFILVTAVLMLSIVTVFWVAYRSMQEMNSNANRERLHVGINLIEEKLRSGVSYQEIDRIVGKLINFSDGSMRYTVIAPSGEVIYDNQAPYQTMENHLFRPEVYRALRNKEVASAIRRSDTQQTDIFYLAEYKQDLDLVIRTAMPMKQYIALMRLAALRMAGIFLFAFIGLSLIGLFAANIIVKPIKMMEQASTDLSVGQLHARMPKSIDPDTEVGKVSVAFNSMADRLQHLVEDLEEKNIQMDTILNSVESGVMAVDQTMAVTFMNRYVTEEFMDPSFSRKGVYPFVSIIRSNEADLIVKQVMQSQKSLDTQIEIPSKMGKRFYRMAVSGVLTPKGKGVIVTLQDITQIHELQKMRSEFVANVTHELKTPLTSIRGFVDTLRDGAHKRPEVAERFLDIIDVEAQRLHKLISDILVLSEMEDSKEDPQTAHFDLFPLIDEIVVLLDEEASAHSVGLVIPQTLQDPSSALFVRANRNRIKQILINLVENAIKYNVPGGTVSIEVHRDEDHLVRIQVADTGKGIPKEHLPRIFERFYRVDKGRSKELGGTGLGLSIVKHIAMLYNGSVKAESRIGKGSTFTVTLQI